MRVIAAAIILLFFYYAAGVVITLLLSILLAYFLDPAVEVLERMSLPRTLRAMVEVLQDWRDVLRDYLAWISIVALVVIASSSPFFWVVRMEYPLLTGIASGILFMVPYIGAVIAWLPAFFTALAKWKTLGEFVLIA